MKKLLAFTLSYTLLCALHANAQKKTWIVEMDGSIDHQDYSSNYSYMNQSSYETLESWTVNVAVGKQFTDRFTAGIMISLGYEQYLTTVLEFNNPSYPILENVKNSSGTYKMGLWGRRTYWLNDRIYVYAQVTADYQESNSNQLAGSYSYSTPVVATLYNTPIPAATNGLSVLLLPGVGVNLVHGFGCHMNLGGLNYTRLAVGDEGGHFNRIQLTIGKQFVFGLHKIIGWQKHGVKQNL